jgi:hypothetical protein
MDILPDEVNVGYDHFKNWVVAKVNGVRINSMKDLVEAFESHNGDYHQILMEHLNGEIILSKKNLNQKSQNILQKYKVIADRSSDLQTFR